MISMRSKGEECRLLQVLEPAHPDSKPADFSVSYPGSRPLRPDRGVVCTLALVGTVRARFNRAGPAEPAARSRIEVSPTPV
jgi:hypothetical protein